ncbi:J domain-containing protein [Spiroplasma endosymbiont of Diplazon laetatorius]|uniref:J domain-containing protein n=1 Tax=Spiroplasma endosymbiont of Diplazon laetatorius TaxID=3066322 RepID=UPI0030CD1EB8
MLLILMGSLSFITIIFLTFSILKKLKNSDKQNDNKHIKKDLEKFKIIFQNQSNKKVYINELKILENFNKFPFMSEFREIYKQYPSDSLISSLKHTQESFYQYWANKEFDFFIIFEKLSKQNLVIFSSESLIKVYNQFSFEIFNIYTSTFIQEVIPSIIAKYENKSYKLLDSNRINDFIDEEFMKFCSEIDKIIVAIETQLLFGSEGSNNSSNGEFIDRSNDEKLTNAYKVLEVSPFDSDEKIRKSYLKLAKTYHPDKNKKEFAKQKMAEINDAYDVVLKERKKD